MKCFECGSKCLTVYNYNLCQVKVMSVQKECMNCDWISYPTKIPEKI